jgi:hypothetical protein
MTNLVKSADAKGRAITARPLAVLLAVGALCFFAMTTAALAIPAPTLTSTNPLSPGSSLTPMVRGNVEEAETKAVTFGTVNGLRPITSAIDLSDTIRVYTTANCSGSPVGEGPLEDLQGEGIAVGTVGAGSVTTFYATVTDNTETSQCSPGLSYRHISGAPAAPVFTGANPPSGTNENLPRLIGSADPEAVVAVYASADCSGGVANSASGAQFGSVGVQVLVVDNSDNTFSAKATLGGFVSPCSSPPLVYKESTPPPETNPGTGEPGGGGGGGFTPATVVTPPPPPRLRMIPGTAANNNAPLVGGTATGASAVRIYAGGSCDDSAIVARGSVAELAAGIPVRVADNVSATFSAVALAGATASKCSQAVTYVEDSLSPHTRITMGPASKTAKRKAVIRFTDTTGDVPGTTYFCKVDKAKWKACSSPLRLKKLKAKRYLVRVKAVDPAGNAEAKGSKRAFKVIRHP